MILVGFGDDSDQTDFTPSSDPAGGAGVVTSVGDLLTDVNQCQAALQSNDATYVPVLCGGYVEAVLQVAAAGNPPPGLNSLPPAYLDVIGQLLTSNPTLSGRAPDAGDYSQGFPIDLINSLAWLGGSDPSRALTYLYTALQQWPGTHSELMNNSYVLHALIGAMASCIGPNTDNTATQNALNQLCALLAFDAQHVGTAVLTVGPFNVAQDVANALNQIQPYLTGINACCILVNGVATPNPNCMLPPPTWSQPGVALGPRDPGNSTDPGTRAALIARYLLIGVGSLVFLGGMAWVFRDRIRLRNQVEPRQLARRRPTFQGSDIDTTITLDRKFRQRSQDALTLSEKARQARGAAARWLKRSGAHARVGEFREADDAQTEAVTLMKMATDLEADAAYLRHR